MIETVQIIFAQSSFVTKLLYSFAIVAGLFGAIAIQRVAYIWTQAHIDMVIDRIHRAEKHLQDMENQRHRRIIEALDADHRTAVHMPDAHGYIGVPRSIVENPANAAALMAYNLQNSYHKRNRKRSTYRYNNTGASQEEAPQLTDSGEYTAPTVNQLISQRIIKPGVVYLGTDVSTGEHKIMDVSDIRGTGVLGWSGSGKSNLVRLLVAQAVASGAQLLAIDPHRHNQESIALSLGPLQSALMLQPAAEDDETKGICQFMLEQMEQRAKLRDCSHLPYLLLIVDELNNVLSRDEVGPYVAELIKTVAREGRKWRIGEIGIGQTFSAQETGSAGMRKSLTNRIALRCDVDDASMFIQRGPLVNGIDDMPVGHAICKGLTLGRPAHISMPLCGMHEVEEIAGIQSSSRPLKNLEKGLKNDLEDLEASSISSPPDKPFSSDFQGDSSTPTAKEKRVVAAIKRGDNKKDIYTIIDPKATSGPRYTEARKEAIAIAKKYGIEFS